LFTARKHWRRDAIARVRWPNRSARGGTSNNAVQLHPHNNGSTRLVGAQLFAVVLGTVGGMALSNEAAG
jgi:hypothetical protein